MEDIMRQRISRLDLDTTKNYEKIQLIKGIEIATLVGRFVKSYRMGSGDGMTAHWEFELEGQTIVVNDEMWGSLGGQELVGFREVTASA
jgi:hypothetical protein